MKEALLRSAAIYIPSSAPCPNIPLFSHHWVTKTLSRHCCSFWMLDLTDPRPGLNPRKQHELRHTSGIIQGCDVHVLIAVIEPERFPSQHPAGNGDTSLNSSRPPLPTPQPRQPLAASRENPSARQTLLSVPLHTPLGASRPVKRLASPTCSAQGRCSRQNGSFIGWLLLGHASCRSESCQSGTASS